MIVVLRRTSRPAAGSRPVGKARGLGALAVMVLAAVVVAAPVAAQDTLEVSWAAGDPGQPVAVPIYIRDVAGTLLDEGDGFNLEIQGFAFRVDFSPAEHVTALDFLQAGVTAGRTPILPVIEPHDEFIYVLLSFSEVTDPLDFTLDATRPGDLVGELILELSPTAPIGLYIDLLLDSTNGSLVNHDATLEETVANGHLRTISGTLTVTAYIFEDDFESGDTSAWTLVVP